MIHCIRKLNQNLLQMVPVIAAALADFTMASPCSLPQNRSALRPLALKSLHMVPSAAPGITTQSYPAVPIPINSKC